ncbi:MAG: GNAT family N-acetyltransferase [Pseudomonadota bacterium]
MSPEDAARAAAIHAQAFAGLARGWSAEEFAALAAAPETWVHAAEDAVLAARLGPPEAELLTLATLPAARRRGRAAALLARFEAAAAARGSAVAFLEVAEDNAAARAVYRRAGWAEAGRRPRYYRRGTARVDALLLRKDLKGEREVIATT